MGAMVNDFEYDRFQFNIRSRRSKIGTDFEISVCKYSNVENRCCFCLLGGCLFVCWCFCLFGACFSFAMTKLIPDTIRWITFNIKQLMQYNFVTNLLNYWQPD